MKSKKVYTAPSLKTQVVALGVFGNYGDTTPSDGKHQPLQLIDDRDLRME